MPGFALLNEFVFAPVVDEGYGGRTLQRLANTGTTETVSVRLSPGRMYALVVGANSVRVRWSGNPALVNAVDPTRDVVFPAGTIIPFRAEYQVDPNDATKNMGTIYVYAEAGDGSSAYECFVYQLQK